MTGPLSGVREEAVALTKEALVINDSILVTESGSLWDPSVKAATCNPLREETR